MACEDNNVHNMSEICLEAWQKQEIHIIDNDCYPKYISPTVSTIATIWCTTNSIVGLSGNLLTLLAIPYVTRLKKRYFVIVLISQTKIFFFCLLKNMYVMIIYSYICFSDSTL